MILSDLYLWLAYSHISTSKINKILGVVPIERLWDSFDKEGKYSLDDKTFSLLKRTHSDEYIQRAKAYLELNHVEYVTRADPAYPPQLDQREVDPPPVLFYKGDIALAREFCIGVVGTRHCTKYGKTATERIVTELAESGVAIVSGLATGIDGFAHSAALNVNGKTVAVLGSGLFNMTPVSNVGLFDEICKKGLVLSEYTPDVHGSVYSFPQRNRIISGLCRGILVVEAAERSGALITADCALEQGRDIFAVPGNIDKQSSMGTNKLIKSGGIAVTCASDILGYYDMSAPRKKRPLEQSIALDFAQSRVMELLGGGECSFDVLVEKSGLSAAEVNTAISSLMLFGLVHERSKNVYTAA